MDLVDRALAYLETRPQNLHGEHRYSASDFGLTSKAIRDQFKFYTDYYGTKLEL